MATTPDLANMRFIADGIELDERRTTLLRGGAAAAPVKGKLVCSCNGVGEDTIMRVIRNHSAAGSCSLATVCATSRAGTYCGSCTPEVGKLIQQHGARNSTMALAT